MYGGTCHVHCSIMMRVHRWARIDTAILFHWLRSYLEGFLQIKVLHSAPPFSLADFFERLDTCRRMKHSRQDQSYYGRSLRVYPNAYHGCITPSAVRPLSRRRNFCHNSPPKTSSLGGPLSSLHAVMSPACITPV